MVSISPTLRQMTLINGKTGDLLWNIQTNVFDGKSWEILQYLPKKNISGSAFALHIDLKSPSILWMEKNPKQPPLGWCQKPCKIMGQTTFPSTGWPIF